MTPPALSRRTGAGPSPGARCSVVARGAGCALRWALALLTVAMVVLWGVARLASPAHAQSVPARHALVIDIDGAIGPATAAHVTRSLSRAEADRAAVVVLRIDTPGGLDTSMRQIIRAVLASRVPVLAFVAPGGSRAASAGAYIVLASPVAAMAPGTNIGAATPVALGGGGAPWSAPAPARPGSGPSSAASGPRAAPTRDPSEAKALNDAVAYMRGLAELHGRNADWAESAVREAASLPAREALERKVIDVMADDVPHLLQVVHGRQVKLADGAHTLDTRGLAVQTVEADWRTRLVAVVTNPNVAMLLIVLGFYGLLFEFMSPGAMVPGVVGGIALLLGLYALSVLPISYAGVALLLFGVALLIAEAFAPSFGILGLGGGVAFVFGAALLVDVQAPGFGVSLPLMAGLATAALLLSVWIVRMAWRSRRQRPVSGDEAWIGQTVPVLDWSGESGHVRMAGERWRATGATGLAAGQRARVRAVQGLTVLVAAEDAAPPNITPPGRRRRAEPPSPSPPS